MASKRGPKIKMLAQNMPPQNFIALGTTSSSAPSAQQSLKTAPKRVDPIEPSASGASAPKKSKVLSHHMTRSSGPIQMRRESGDHWEEFAQEVDSTLLLDRVIEAEDVSDERVEALLCGAVRQLRTQRSKPDSTLYLTLCYLAKTRPLLFCTEVVVEAFCSLLKRDSTLSYKTKVNNSVAILSANILLAVYHDENNWPDQFLKVFIDDSLGERVWVDSEDCKGFVDNLLASFNTKTPPKSMLQQDILTTSKLTEASSLTSSPNHPAIVTDEASLDETSFSTIPMTNEMKEHLENIAVMSRFTHNDSFVVQYVTDIVNEQLNRRQAPSDVSRNMLKLLLSTVGIQAVRLIVAQKLEQWLQNPKLTRPAQDLLLTLCINCNESDGEVISQMVKMRLKTKPLTNHFIICMKEMLNQTDDTFRLLLRTVLYNEVSPQRGLNNLPLISIMFQHSPEKATKVLAEVFQEMMTQKEDYLKTLRGLLREIVRALRHEHINYLLFAQHLVEEGQPFIDLDPSEFAIRERAVTTITDLLTMIMFLSLSPAVKEAFSTTKPDRREIIRNYQMQVSNIQRLAIQWLQKTVIKSFRPERNEYLHCLNKVLFMESAEHYYHKDGWPPENDRNLMFRMTSEVPLLEDTLIRILSMGSSKDNPLTSAEAIELSDALIKRAASITEYDSLTYPVIMISDKQIFSLLMANAIYRHPDNITLPSGYEPPNMAISDLYWKIWIQLLILTAHNPTEFGALGWEGYPTLRILIEMSITNHFQFPPPTKTGDDLINREIQINAFEKQSILQFESYLAAASTKVQINETNSLLLSKLITMDPLGPARKPPPSVLEQFKQLNSVLRLGHLLCQSRNPDFLLEIIQRQQKQMGSAQLTTAAPMPWLVELVESNENNFGMLPVQCLCEFLLGQISEEESAQPLVAYESSTKFEKCKRKEKRRKHLKLISHLQTVISSQSTCSKELIEYFMKRLSFQQSSARTLASKALSLVLSSDANAIPDDKPLVFTEVEDWLLNRLPQTSNFEFIRSSACDSLRPAILVETVPNAICHYIQFLSRHDQIGSSDLALDCAHILVDRQLITNCILLQKQLKGVFLNSLLNVFLAHLVVKRRPAREIYSWTDTQDHIMVQWKNDEAAILHIIVVHAMIILLTFEPMDSNQSAYNQLMDTWFCDPQPQAFLVDTSEQALLIPDWLRLKLLKSSSPRLIEAALKDVDSSQLILFIQSFGLSVSSMDRLLQELDSMVALNPEDVKDSIVDELLILRVVEVQWMRGCKSGYKFAQLLGHLTDETVIKEEKMETNETDITSTGTQIDVKFSTFKTDLIQYLTKDKSNSSRFLMKLSRELTHELFDKKVLTKKFTKLFLTEFTNHLNECIELINRGEFNPLLNVIITFVTKDTKHLGLKNEIISAIKRVKECSEVKNATIFNIFERFTKISKTSQKSKTVKTERKQKKSHKKTVEELAKMILKSEKGLDSNKGLLLERFHKMEPELVLEGSQSARLETQLLFSRNCLYLLSLLIHKTRFETLNSCIKSVLSDDQNLSDLDATAVLDFLTACLGSPRLWIGRDLNQPKHLEYEDVLKLNENQIKKLIHFVIEEGNAEKRVELVIKSCCLNETQIKLVVNILKEIENLTPDSTIASEMLFRLYLQIPSIEQPLKLVENDFIINSQEPSVADRVTHNLLTAFTSIETPPTRSQTTYLSDCELSLLKMASKHPILFLRQIPLIPALLKGKISSVTYEVFKSRNYLLLFKRILNILRLLKPYLWNKHVKGLNELLSSYLQLFIAYCHCSGKGLLPVLSQFLFLIDDWIKFDAESAKVWIKTNRKLIFDLSTVYSEQMLFKSILSGLPFQTQSSVEKQLLPNILVRLRQNKSNAEQMNAVLNDLDKITDSKPEILEHFVDDLRQLYFNPFSRQMAFQLTIKLLKYNPSHSKSFVPTFCQCLQRNDFYLANLALEYLPEFLILAQEHRTIILKKAFEIGIMGNTNVINNMCESFALMNAQMGY